MNPPHLLMLFVLALVALGACDSSGVARQDVPALAERTDCGDDDDDDGDGDDEDDDDHGPGEFLCDQIVLYGLSGVDEARLREAGYARIAARRSTLLDENVVRLRTPPGLSEAGALRRALEIAPDARGDLNHVYRPQQGACEGAHCAIAAALAWPQDVARCGSGLRVGLIDTPVDRAHPALRGRAIRSFDAIGRGRSPATAEHGTAMASLMVGAPGGPAPGLAPRAQLIAVNAFHIDARGRPRADAADLVAALDRLASQRTPVVNLSLAGPDNVLLAQAVAALSARGTTIVAAVGNEARARPRYPAGYSGVVGVTAVDARARPYRLANQGSHVDFAAPGVAVTAAAPGGAASTQSGTSHAAAIAAIIIASERRDGGHLAAITQLAARARDLGPPGRDARFGAGLMQARVRC